MIKYIKIILLIVIFVLPAFSKVTLNSSSYFIKGEPFVFEFEAIGKDISFPKIDYVDNYIVKNLGTSRVVQIINGNYDEKLTKGYTLVPRADFTIPSFTFSINGKQVKTLKKKIILKKISKTASSSFDLTLTSSKKELYIGEDVFIKLVFKYKRGQQITNIGFRQPNFDNFWYKKVNNSNKRYEENGYIVQELEFLLFPQKNGKLTISPLRVDIQMMNSSSSTFGFFSSAPKVVKIYSNELTFDVKELPENLTLIGDFDITASVDKTNIKQGESISYKLKIQGNGNFDDIDDIKLDIDDAIVYDNKPEIKTSYLNSLYKGIYSKNYSIVPTHSLEIPSITLKYFSKKDKKIVIKKTKSFKITVKNQVSKKVTLEKSKEKFEVTQEIKAKPESSLEKKITYFIFGILSTLLIIGLYKYVKILQSKKKHKEIPLIKLVKKSKTKQELMKVLIPYIRSNAILDKLIFDCESDKDFKILKKQIIDLLKEIKV